MFSVNLRLFRVEKNFFFFLCSRSIYGHLELRRITDFKNKKSFYPDYNFFEALKGTKLLQNVILDGSLTLT